MSKRKTRKLGPKGTSKLYGLQRRMVNVTLTLCVDEMLMERTQSRSLPLTVRRVREIADGFAEWLEDQRIVEVDDVNHHVNLVTYKVGQPRKPTTKERTLWW